nr:hypothetical protein [Sneathiella glossodoripedis]
MLDLLIRNARIVGATDRLQDIAVKDGQIVDVAPSISGDTAKEYDADGYLVSTPFIDSHFHMDATLSYGRQELMKVARCSKGSRCGES